MYSQYLESKRNEKRLKDEKNAQDREFQLGVKNSPKLERSESVGSMEEKKPLSQAEIAILKHKSKSHKSYL